MIYYLGDNKPKSSKIKYCTQEDILNYCRSRPYLGVDTETTRRYKKNLYDERVYQPGLDPYMSKICMFQIGDLENQFIIDARKIDCSFLKEILEDKNILKILHNAKFDAKHILFNYDITLNNVWDTMICERLLYNGERLKYSLEALSNRYLGIESTSSIDLFNNDNIENEYELDQFESLEYKEKTYIDKSIRTLFINIGDTPFSLKEIEYGAEDITYPCKIYLKQKEGRYVDNELYLPIVGFKLENKFTTTLAKIELRGFKVNVEGWNELYLKNIKIYAEKKERLDDWVIKHHPRFATQINLFSSIPTCNIEWTSPQQVVEFAKYLKICPKEKSKSTGFVEYTVGAKAMSKLLNNENKDRFLFNQELEFNGKDDFQAFILNFLLLKKYQQLTTTFGKDWLRFIHPITKKVHTNFIQLMNTTRLSSTSPNLQQLPHGKEWRSLFVAGEGNKILSTDYDTQEIRVLAEVSGVKSMQDFFIKEHPVFKKDFHSYSATAMYRIIRQDPELIINKKDHANERTVSKALTFKTSYGGSAFTIAQDLGVSEEEGEKYLQGYFDGFPGLEENFKETKKLALKRGWVELDPYTKKRYFFPDFTRMNELYEEAWSYYPPDYRSYSKTEKEEFKKNLKITNPEVSELWKEYMILKGKLERVSLNYRIQGFSASLSKLAVMLIENSCPKEFGIINIVHDEVCEEHPENIVIEREKITLQAFIDSGTYICKVVPMSGTAEIGDYWIH